MELRITTKMEPGTLPEIRWNNSELKEEIRQKAQEYASIAYTDSQTAEMRKDRAALNRLVTAFEAERKKVKKFYAEPYEKFEVQVKEVLEPVRDAIATIDNGLKEAEKKYRDEKTEKMRSLYGQYVGDLCNIIPFEKTIKETLYKKTIKDKHLEDSYRSFFERVREEMESLEKLPERFRKKATLKYLENFSVAEAIREGKRLEEMEKALEERKCREEQQKKEKITEKATGPGENRDRDAASQEPVVVAETQEETYTLEFRVCGTKKQIMDLREYMVRNNIQFGKVE